MENFGAAYLQLGIFLGGLVLFLILEMARPYRVPAQSKAGRWMINLGLAGFNAILVRFLFAGLTAGVFLHLAQNRTGLFQVLEWPFWARVLGTVILLDFYSYVWHLMNHKVPLLWRFHRVHHCDPEMDVSTANRFHSGELVASAVLRIGLIFFFGAELWGVVIFDAALTLSTQFHHSSLRIPAWLDRAWLVLFVPPSLHRIHHSVKIRERDTNYGVIFSLWDRFMGTLETGVDQEGIRIGVGAYRDFRKLGFLRLLVQPFTPPVR